MNKITQDIEIYYRIEFINYSRNKCGYYLVIVDKNGLEINGHHLATRYLYPESVRRIDSISNKAIKRCKQHGITEFKEKYERHTP